jgi:hypothetical protein
MAQTAVDWFYKRILAEDIKEVFKQAKAMEKQQMIDFAKQWEERQNEGNLDSMKMLYNEMYTNGL